MRGHAQFNFPAFDRAANLLRQGVGVTEVFNPADRDRHKYGPDFAFANGSGSLDEAARAFGFSLRDSLGADLAWICKHADAVVLLPGWDRSLGATAEMQTAQALGLRIGEFTDPPLARWDEEGGLTIHAVEWWDK
jgi:hypothetical protein